MEQKTHAYFISFSVFTRGNGGDVGGGGGNPTEAFFPPATLLAAAAMALFFYPQHPRITSRSKIRFKENACLYNYIYVFVVLGVIAAGTF